MSDPNLIYSWKKSRDQLQNNYDNANEDCVSNTFLNTYRCSVSTLRTTEVPSLFLAAYTLLLSPRTPRFFHKLCGYPHVPSRYYSVMFLSFNLKLRSVRETNLCYKGFLSICKSQPYPCNGTQESALLDSQYFASRSSSGRAQGFLSIWKKWRRRHSST